MIHRYVREINRIYRSGHATEHSYRPALKKLIENIVANSDETRRGNIFSRKKGFIKFSHSL